MTRAITDVQQRSWDAVQEHGTYRAAARALGVTQGAVQSGVAGYRQKLGIDAPPPRTAPSQRAALVNAIPERLDAIEAHLVEIDEGIASLTSVAQGLRDLLRELNGRAPILLVERVATHRRQVDGGVGGKVERSGRG